MMIRKNDDFVFYYFSILRKSLNYAVDFSAILNIFSHFEFLGLYTFIYQGVCGKRGPEPTYALLERVLAQSPSSMASFRGPLTISNTAPLPMQKLRDGNYAIVVKTAPADGSIEIFCGDVS